MQGNPIESRLARELRPGWPAQIEPHVALLDEGNTHSFITRDRKEVTDGLDEETAAQAGRAASISAQSGDAPRRGYTRRWRMRPPNAGAAVQLASAETCR